MPKKHAKRIRVIQGGEFVTESRYLRTIKDACCREHDRISKIPDIQNITKKVSQLELRLNEHIPFSKYTLEMSKFLPMVYEIEKSFIHYHKSRSIKPLKEEEITNKYEARHSGAHLSCASLLLYAYSPCA